MASADTRLSQLQQQQRVIEGLIVDRLARLQSDRADLFENFHRATSQKLLGKIVRFQLCESVLDRTFNR